MNELSRDYIAGFIDGEGCFCLRYDSRRTRRYFYFKMQLKLRDDDRDILLKIKEVLNGIGYIRDYQPSKKYRNSNPATEYVISASSHIEKLIEFLGDNPFHAKKANDYILWKEAFEYYNTLSLEEKRSEKVVNKMNDYSRRLKDGRRYKTDET